MKSMTAYGKGMGGTAEFRVMCEMKGVNSKRLDSKFFLPSKHVGVETDLRKICKEKINRGRIDVFFRYEDSKQKSISGKQGKAVSGLMDDMLEFAKEKNINLTVSPSDLLRMVNYVAENSSLEDLDYEAEFKAYKEAMTNALEAFDSVKIAEGEAMKKEIENLLNRGIDIIKQIEQRAPEMSKLYKDKLLDRVTKMLNGHDINELSIINEVAIVADRTDVREEIVRFLTHAEKFKELMESEKAMGKNLDFLAQEMHREVNTIGSKTQDIEISSMVVKLKSIIEQIREQVQNIE